MDSPIGTGLKLIGLGFLIYHFGLQNWFFQQYLKWRVAAPKQATQLEQTVNPVVKPIQEQLQQQSPQQSTNQSNQTPQPTPTPIPYGMELNLNTPLGFYNSQIKVAPGDMNRTKRDLDAK
ncbi:MAG: hypothetical protein ACM37W_24305 [Actinomycetota bacterium]